jgi:ankyrin repeat protein
MSNKQNTSSLGGSSDFVPELISSTLNSDPWNSKSDTICFESVLDQIPDFKIESQPPNTMMNTDLNLHMLNQELNYFRAEKERLEALVRQVIETNNRLVDELQKVRRDSQGFQQGQQVNERQQMEKSTVRNDDYIQLLNDDQYPFPRYTVLEGTVRPYPVIIIRYPGSKEHLVVKAEPSPGYRFTIENHMAFFKPKDQSFVEHRQVGDIIIFDDMHILGVGNAEGEPIQIDFSLYSLVGSNPVLLAQKRSPPITVFNHSQYLPAPSITKLLPNWTFVGQRPKVEVFGPLFLRKNNILECQIIEEDGREIALLKGNAILRKRNCFHSFSFTAPDHPPGRVWVRARYKDREFGEGRPFEYWMPTSQASNQSRQAVPVNDVNIKSVLPEIGADNVMSNSGNQNPNNVFHTIMTFAFQGNMHGIMMALEGQDSRQILNQRDKNGVTPLYWAAHRGFSEVVKLLIDKGADVNTTAGRGETPLHIAVCFGHLDTVKQLLACGAKVNCRDHSGMTPIHVAALSGHDYIIKELVDFVDDADELLVQKDYDGLTALHIAIMASQPSSFNMLVNEMVNYQIPLDIADKNKMTPLHWAVALDNVPFVLTLVYYLHQYPHTFGINARDSSKETPLHYAVRNKNLEIARILLQNCADPNIPDANKETPLFFAVREKSEDIVHLLLDYGADPSLVNSTGQNAFELNEQKTLASPSNVTMPPVLPLASLTPTTPKTQESLSSSPNNTMRTDDSMSLVIEAPPIKVDSGQLKSDPVAKATAPLSVSSTDSSTKIITSGSRQNVAIIPTTTPTPTPTPTSQLNPSSCPQPLKFPLTESVIDEIAEQLRSGTALSSIASKTATAADILALLNKTIQEREKEYKIKLDHSENLVKQLQGEVVQLKNELAALRIAIAGNANQT